MRWTRIAWAGCAAPLLGGCLGVYHPHEDHLAEHTVAHSQAEVSREIHRRAREAWQTVRAEFPRKMFTAEFRDGFLDGYSDYLDRGGEAQPPAVPPLRYTQNKKYFTPEGHALVRDYFLGFQYGTEVAIATGARQYFTVPVLIPEQASPPHLLDPLPPAAPANPIPQSDAPVKPKPVANPMPPVKPAPLPGPEPLPIPKQMSRRPVPKPPAAPAPMPEDDGLSKFAPTLSPRPVLEVPAAEIVIPPVPAAPAVPTSGKSEPSVPKPAAPKLPEPPREVGSIPDDIPTPPVIHDLPPLNLPVIHPDPVKK